MAEEKAAKEARFQELAQLQARGDAAKKEAEALRMEAKKEAARIKAMRQREAVEATQKLRTAQLALEEAKRVGREDVAAAQERARLATIEEMEARAATRGQMAMTEVVSEERKASGDSS